jgi:hypothetical protein
MNRVTVAEAERDTPDRAYRASVLPLGLFMAFAGLILPLSAILMPAQSFLVFPESERWLQRVVFGGLSLLLLPLGIGLCLRSRFAWWGSFAWLLAGTTWNTVTAILNSRFDDAIVGPLVTIPLAIGIFFVTKPAFMRPTSSAVPTPETESPVD